MMKGTDIVVALLTKVYTSKTLSKPLMGRLDKLMYKLIVEDELDKYPKIILQRRYEFMRAMLKCSRRNMEKGYISKDVIKKVIKTLITLSFLQVKEKAKRISDFHANNGVYPPNFIVLSPTQKCNLNCIGCYADSNAKSAATLPYDVVEKIMDEAYNKFGNKFMTISGGEPFMYKDQGKTILDIFEKYNDMFFLVYTNGTLITKEVAKKLAKLGNVTPAISVEGHEVHTDQRRGKGVYKRLLETFANLREVGVPFGVSVTATQLNFDILNDDEFYDFLFKKQGITYMWEFQFMPIGRAKADAHLMITPEQRVKLYKKWTSLMVDKEYCIADFWNSGMLSNGCVAYARKQAGYLYINWDGNIMPCVFVPYYVDNILDLHKKGLGMTYALKSQFFENGRKWQEEYGVGHTNDPDNWLMPCSLRDHYKNFKYNIVTPDVKAENKIAEEALHSKEYEKMMDKFDKRLEELTLPMWKAELAGKKNGKKVKV